MSDKPKRRFFQIHLSTAIVLMFVTGGYLWFALRPRNVQLLVRWGDKVYSESQRVIGWPMAHHGVDALGLEIDVPPLILSITVNSVVMLSLLVSVAAACEFFIRRPEAHKR